MEDNKQMNDIRRAMKLSLIFGAISAVAVPVIFELYANVSRAGAVVILSAWAVFVGVKLSGLTVRSAFLAASAVLAYTLGLGLVAFVVIHPMTVKALEKSSKYFYLPFREIVMFLISAALIMLLVYIVIGLIIAARYAVAHIKSNGERVEAYIDNAFKDGDGE